MEWAIWKPTRIKDNQRLDQWDPRDEFLSFMRSLTEQQALLAKVMRLPLDTDYGGVVGAEIYIVVYPKETGKGGGGGGDH